MDRFKVLEKFASDSRVYSFDFSLQPEEAGVADIVSCTVTVVPSGVTIGTPAIVGKTVTAQISEGSIGTTYLLRATATTSLGAIMTAYGRMTILDPTKL